MDRTDKVQGGRRSAEARRLEEFEGRWTLTRVIDDHSAGRGRFAGSAVFAPEADGLVYTEQGTLTLSGGGQFAATRRYHWRTTGTDIAVFFDDGRFFHSFDAGVRPAAVHFCDPDQYSVAYDFGMWPRWQSRWTVLGPRKDYTMVSTYAPDR